MDNESGSGNPIGPSALSLVELENDIEPPEIPRGEIALPGVLDIVPSVVGAVTNILAPTQVNSQIASSDVPPTNMVQGNSNLMCTGEKQTINYTVNNHKCCMPDRTNSRLQQEPPVLRKGLKAVAPVPYKKICLDVIRYYRDRDDQELQDLIYLATEDHQTGCGISEETADQIKTPRAFIKCLEESQLLGPSNVCYLLYLLETAEVPDLLDKLNTYNNFQKTLPLHYQPQNSSRITNGTIQSEVVLKGKPEDYGFKDVDEIREFIERTHLPSRTISLTGIGEGSVVLIFQLPIQWKSKHVLGESQVIHVADRLQQLVNENIQWLQQHNVIGVHIEGFPYTDLCQVSNEIDNGFKQSASDNGNIEETKETSETKDTGLLTSSSDNSGNIEDTRETKDASFNKVEYGGLQALYDVSKDPYGKESKAQLKDIAHRINLLDSMKIRYPAKAFKNFVKKLQMDMKQEAVKLQQHGYLDDSIGLYREAIRIYEHMERFGYSPNNALNRKLQLSCAKGLIDLGRGTKSKMDLIMGYNDCMSVMKRDSSDNNAKELFIVATHELLDLEQDSEIRKAVLESLLVYIKHLPHEVQALPDIAERKKALEIIFSPEDTDTDTGIGSDASVITTQIAKAQQKQARTKSKLKVKTNASGSLTQDGNREISTKRTRSRRARARGAVKSRGELASKSDSGLGSDMRSTGESETDDCVGCDYCKNTEPFMNDVEREQHINTPEHRRNLNSDDKKPPWKWRTPPRNVINGNYSICERNRRGECPFSNTDPKKNSCPRAHSDDELQEWNERHEFRKMKIAKAGDSNLYSFLEDLIVDYSLIPNEIEVMTENEPGTISITCDQGLKQRFNCDGGTDLPLEFEWTFSIDDAKQPLKRIGLLYDTFRTHFWLSSPEDKDKPQVCYRNHIQSDEEIKTITVHFRSSMLGSFEQWVVFDHGNRPVVVKKLYITIGGDDDSDVEFKSTETVASESWDTSNRTIIPFSSSWKDDPVTPRYRPSDFSPNPGDLDPENYTNFMHEMLKLEETERLQQIKSQRMELEMEVMNVISINSNNRAIYFKAKHGQQYGSFKLKDRFLDDSNASHIISTDVHYVYLEFDSEAKTVYEAMIFERQEIEDRKRDDVFYVTLSSKCVADMTLSLGKKQMVKMQFKLDRQHFQKMHDAIDKFNKRNIEMIFPQPNPNPALISPRISTIRGINAMQEGALRFICSRSEDQNPLLLLYGPFGTGKTYTLAHAVMHLLKGKNPSERILICTHSNSAADLYIIHYLASFIEKIWKKKAGKIKMRRVYAATRDLRTVKKEIMKYTAIEGGNTKIDMEEIKSSNIVITTTSTATRLFGLRQGHFTHILIDEAAQILETEAIIPLALAGPETRVVLAGDHRQMGPRVYSEKAKAKGFTLSLLERLFHFCVKHKRYRQVLLRWNYRTCTEILQFLSREFYDAGSIQAKGKHPSQTKYYPLEFRAVMGEDKARGASYINDFEILEIGKRLVELKENWPHKEWGPFRQSEIGVLTPYTMQVKKIRNHLSKLGLSDITVERVQNVQGKEYRVIIISTVRTHHTVNIELCENLNFLSDCRQLNTAFTRAQSLIVVVGNPLALTSIGDCCLVWDHYIKECMQQGSMYPTDLTYSDIKQAAESQIPQRSANIRSERNRHRAMASPAQTMSQHLPQTPEADVSKSIQQFLTKKAVATNQPHHEETRTSYSTDDTDEDSDEEGYNSDIIMKELAREHREASKEYEDGDTSSTDSDEEAHRLDRYRMVQDDDYHVTIAKGAQEEDQEQVADDEQIRCRLRIAFDGKIYATPLDDTLAGSEIHISTNTQRKTALDGDEVLVEILKEEEEKEDDHQEIDENSQNPMYGQVVQVTNRAVDMTGREFICIPDKYVDNLMSPIDRTLPKIFILRPKEERGNHRQHTGSLTIPICHFKGKRCEAKRIVPVSNRDRPNKLFLVRWLSWREDFYYPLGMVVDDMPIGENEDNGLYVLKHKYDVIEEPIPITHPLPDRLAEIKRRSDFDFRLVKNVFTIDPEGTEDFDDALSIDTCSDDEFDVGIHIADVSYFVPQGSEIDLKAKERATSFYPADSDPVYMLPQLICTDKASLVQGYDRLTMSVTVRLTASGDIVQSKSRICRSVVRCKRNFSYADVEQVLCKSGPDSSSTQQSIRMLYTLAQGLRRNRLGKGMYAQSDIASNYKAHILVEEMMILANRTIATFLLEKFPKCTPLRRQQPPEKNQFEEWVTQHEHAINDSMKMNAERDWLSRVLETSTMIFPIESGDDKVLVLEESWEKLRKYVENATNTDIDYPAIFLGSDRNHPQFAPAYTAFLNMMRKGEYVSSGDVHTPEDLLHTSLHSNAYTHFTSPLRRYIDILAHRLVVAALTTQEEAPYESKDVSEICHHCSIRSYKASEFHRKCDALQLALETKHTPLKISAVVERVTEDDAAFGFQCYPTVMKACRREIVKLKHFKLHGKPDWDQTSKKSARLSWDERIYQLKPNKDIMVQGSKKQIENVTLSLATTRFVASIPRLRLAEMFRCIEVGDQRSLYREILSTPVESNPSCVFTNRQTATATNTRLVKDVSCDIDEASSTEKDSKDSKGDGRQRLVHSIRFTRDLAIQDVVQVQLHASLKKGILSSGIALVNMTPSLEFCTEHLENPVSSFGDIVDTSPVTTDIAQYQSSWTSIIEMMSTREAVENNETVLIHGVPIEWQYQHEHSYPCGSFTLPAIFCKTRRIRLRPLKLVGMRHHYVCIRYQGIKENDATPSYLSREDQHHENPVKRCDQEQHTFVAHAYIVDVEGEDEKSDSKIPVTVFFQVNQCSTTFPVELFTGSASRATIELILKTTTSRRAEQAIRSLTDAKPLIKNICTREPLETDNPEHMDSALKEEGSNIKSVDVPFLGLRPLNDSQEKALRKSLTQPFTIIQGPPGTGKTVTGAYLVHFFNQINLKLNARTRRNANKYQVLYCGPSNKSVDVIADYLNKSKHSNMSILRVYSEHMERQDFPIPGDTEIKARRGRPDTRVDDKLKSIALHHKIRSKHNGLSEVITNFESRFSNEDPPNDEDIEKHRKKIRKAEANELKTHDVILCTCNEAGSARIRGCTNIVQCIVDEAGMCSEPETLIPLVSTKPRQVVLIGDHKQLRPIIKDQIAQQLGVEISLLERYAKDTAVVTMLNTQYRMHKSICEFPSKKFYDDKLITAPSVRNSKQHLPIKWPGGNNQTTVFCHTVGREDRLTVTTDEGNEMSRANAREKFHVVRIANALVNYHNIDPARVVILSQYRLQCSNIALALKDRNLTGIAVQTVIKSQGSEWDYVILSTVRSLSRIKTEKNPTCGWRKRYLGFITDENQMNVALTRARKGLIIVGNQNLLRADKRWRELLDYYEEKHCLLPAPLFLPQRQPMER